MKNINEYTKNKKSKKELNEILKREFVLATKDENFIKLCNKLDLKEKVLMKYTTKLENTVQELNNCKGCKGLGQCKNKLCGYVNYPTTVVNDTITFSYKACKYRKKLEENINDNVTYFEIPEFLKTAKMSDLYIDDKKRINIIKYVNEFIKKYNTKNKLKGLYVHGSFGSGKSYIISALINELSKKDVSGVIVYYPNLLKKLKDSFNANNYEDIFDEIISCDILLLDDLGAENNTSWSRDEILGSILQSRMDNNLSTFITSNLSLEELEAHLKSTRDSSDKVKARRIIERIKQLTDTMELVSENRRK